MVSRCYLCGGKTERRVVTAENWWGESLALVENVPAWVCQQCGEAYFEAATSRQLDGLRKAPPTATRTISVPVYPFADVA
ncbi:MAG: type II toxin-antitoxin system MqsA family antitoxin [Chloroflexota bacterium]